MGPYGNAGLAVSGPGTVEAGRIAQREAGPIHAPALTGGSGAAGSDKLRLRFSSVLFREVAWRSSLRGELLSC